MKKIPKIKTALLATIMIWTMVLAPFSIDGTVKKADGAYALEVTQLVHTGINSAHLTKQAITDQIFWAIAKYLLVKIVNSFVAWVNSGFAGDPAFVVDLSDFMATIADDLAQDFIVGDGFLAQLCTPFELDVRLALQAGWQTGTLGGLTATDGTGTSAYRAQCTLADVTENVESFLAGDFASGGWDAWFTMTQEPSNTAIGAYLQAEGALFDHILGVQENERTELQWSGGFLSFKSCASGGSGSRGQTGPASDPTCEIVTPGRVISEALDFQLTVGQENLIAADEISEVIVAAFAWLATKNIMGGSGLRGVDPNELQKIEDDSRSLVDASFGGLIEELDRLSDRVSGVISDLDSAQNEINRVYSRFDSEEEIWTPPQNNATCTECENCWNLQKGDLGLQTWENQITASRNTANSINNEIDTQRNAVNDLIRMDNDSLENLNNVGSGVVGITEEIESIDGEINLLQTDIQQSASDFQNAINNADQLITNAVSTCSSCKCTEGAP